MTVILAKERLLDDPNSPDLWNYGNKGPHIVSLSPLRQGGGMKIVDGRFGQPVYPASQSTHRIVLLPENFLLSETGHAISRRDFLSVLANVTRVMVRASYSTEPSAMYR